MVLNLWPATKMAAKMLTVRKCFWEWGKGSFLVFSLQLYQSRVAIIVTILQQQISWYANFSPLLFYSFKICLLEIILFLNKEPIYQYSTKINKKIVRWFWNLHWIYVELNLQLDPWFQLSFHGRLYNMRNREI